jgi:hypothetical protein
MTTYDLILTTKGAGKATYRFKVDAPYSIDALAKGRELAEANGFTAYNLGIADPRPTYTVCSYRGPAPGDFWDPRNADIYSAPAR